MEIGDIFKLLHSIENIIIELKTLNANHRLQILLVFTINKYEIFLYILNFIKFFSS